MTQFFRKQLKPQTQNGQVNIMARPNYGNTDYGVSSQGRGTKSTRLDFQVLIPEQIVFIILVAFILVVKFEKVYVSKQLKWAKILERQEARHHWISNDIKESFSK